MQLAALGTRQLHKQQIHKVAVAAVTALATRGIGVRARGLLLSIQSKLIDHPLRSLKSESQSSSSAPYDEFHAAGFIGDVALHFVVVRNALRLRSYGVTPKNWTGLLTDPNIPYLHSLPSSHSPASEYVPTLTMDAICRANLHYPFIPSFDIASSSSMGRVHDLD